MLLSTVQVHATRNHEVLGVSPTASAEDIKLAYRRLVRQHHPDLNPTPEDNEKMKEITKAFRELEKSGFRQGSAQSQSSRANPNTSNSNQGRPFHESDSHSKGDPFDFDYLKRQFEEQLREAARQRTYHYGGPQKSNAPNFTEEENLKDAIRSFNSQWANIKDALMMNPLLLVRVRSLTQNRFIGILENLRYSDYTHLKTATEYSKILISLTRLYVDTFDVSGKSYRKMDISKIKETLTQRVPNLDSGDFLARAINNADDVRKETDKFIAIQMDAAIRAANGAGVGSQFIDILFSSEAAIQYLVRSQEKTTFINAFFELVDQNQRLNIASQFLKRLAEEQRYVLDKNVQLVEHKHLDHIMNIAVRRVGSDLHMDVLKVQVLIKQLEEARKSPFFRAGATCNKIFGF